VHGHDEYSDHDHDHHDFDDDGPIEQNPIWMRIMTLTSVGDDIGSAGTQVIFSRINLRRGEI
jgi:ethanolamine utilization protein EutA